MQKREFNKRKFLELHMQVLRVVMKNLKKYFWIIINDQENASLLHP